MNCIFLHGAGIGCSFALACGTFWQSERVEHVLHRHEHVLPTVQFVGHRRCEQLAAHVQVPECLSVRGIEREQISGIVRAEQQTPCGGEDPGNTFALTEFVIPHDFAITVL